MLAYDTLPHSADLRAELADLHRQRPALAARVTQTELTAVEATDALAEARRHYDRCVLRARDARAWADEAARVLRAHDAAIAAVLADLKGCAA